MDDEPLEQMTQKKDQLQDKANELKKKRDTLHDQSKKLARERDEINAKVRQIRNQISEHKKKRDEYNERVKHAKEQRNEFLTSHVDLKKKVKELERERTHSSGVNVNELKQHLRKLETEQMTQPMSAQKEKKLIETIKGIHLQIKAEEEKLNKDPKLKKAIEEEKLLRQKAEKQHDLVEKMAKKAQEEHQEMIEKLQQLDKNVKRTTEIQENIVMMKIEADKVHKDFIDHVNAIHELEKTIVSSEKKKEKKKKMDDVSAAQKQADEVFERFKRGEKLSTEDLMILQKAGLL
ncbi:MAG: hypothetical protein JXA00_04145 [Candidatus Thermoplasmatota archaeon]|nr:hypothetical protein [Candidatus Thermoplasmatota archaeon]